MNELADSICSVSSGNVHNVDCQFRFPLARTMDCLPFLFLQFADKHVQLGYEPFPRHVSHQTPRANEWLGADPELLAESIDNPIPSSQHQASYTNPIK
eukprot:7222328-Karenia_brevis.AAC.1